MKNKIFIFNFVEDILFFWETNYFFQKNPSPPPPLNIKWSVPYGHLFTFSVNMTQGTHLIPFNLLACMYVVLFDIIVLLYFYGAGPLHKTAYLCCSGLPWIKMFLNKKK